MKINKEISQFLISRDSNFEKLVDIYGLFSRGNSSDVYYSLIRNIIGQMLSNQVAKVLMERFLVLVGDITPEKVNKVDIESIKSIGISYKKASYITDLTKLLTKGEINLSKEYLVKLDEEELKKYLMSIRGIGEWTAEMIMLFVLEKENVFSWNDVALKRGIMKVHKEYKTLSRIRFEKLRKMYSPYCSYASLYFYAVNDDKGWE